MNIALRWLASSLLWLCLWPVSAAQLPEHPAIATANAYATDAGLEVLAKGGNAFDAVVAISATLGLVEPESSGLGGGGFFLFHLADSQRQVFIDAREKAPLGASRDMYLGADGQADRSRSVDGGLAAAIPGLPAGLLHVSRHYGRLPLADVLAPAIRLARQGWTFGAKNQAMMGYRRDALRRNAEAARLFLLDGEVPPLGHVMRNPDYAATLERLVASADAGFYSGEFAKRLVAGVNAAGGVWREADLAQYRVVEREPLLLSHRGFRIVTAPPPSSGGIALAQILQILDGSGYYRSEGLERVHWLTEAMRRAYRDRAIYLGDPDFVQVPIARLMSADYAAGLRAGIHPERPTPSALLPGVRGSHERDETTHFSIIDQAGNVAAVTQTVNLPYGDAVVVPGTGFLLNNEMDDFSVKPGVPNAFGLVGDAANAIEPGKRPLSSMTPSILLGQTRVAAIGTPGGSRIISMVLLGVLALIDGQSAQQAAAAPRIHHQYLPDVLSVEPGALSAEIIQQLQARGQAVEAAERSWGNMQIVSWDTRSGSVEAGSDPRWQGVGKAAIGEAGSIYR